MELLFVRYLRSQYFKNCRFNKKYRNPVFPRVDILPMVVQKAIIHIQRISHFLLLVTVTPGENMITRQMTAFFINSLSTIFLYISPLYFKTFKIQLFRYCVMFCSIKHTFICQRWHFKPVNTNICFQHKTC